MNSSIVRTKHLLNYHLQRTQQVVRDNWFKILLVLLVAFIIARKDLNFQINLSSSGVGSTAQNPATTTALATSLSTPAATAPTEDFGEVEMHQTTHTTTTPTSTKPQIPDNRAQSFSNLGFILNPSYAKRHNISPEIVAEKNQICLNYIQKFAKVAVEDMHRYGIPASITLAQGLLESNAGDSRLARESNNHFGIKCFSTRCAKGHCRNYTDDSHKDFFRTYENAFESYEAHSQFLQKDRYKHLLALKTDYKKWAHGLKKAGYATDKRYGEKLIQIIESLKLYQYDRKK